MFFLTFPKPEKTSKAHDENLAVLRKSGGALHFRNVTLRQKIGAVLAPPVPAGRLYRYSMKPHD